MNFLKKKTLANKTSISKFEISNIKAIAYQLAENKMEEIASKMDIPTTLIKEKPCLFSKICEEKDFETNWMHYWIKACGLPVLYQRKYWEFAYICHALFELGFLEPGKSGLGFGCGQEPLPSVFAKFGVNVLATDAPEELSIAQGWAKSGQHSDSIKKIQNKSICPDETLLNNIKFEGVDMNNIPQRLNSSFDFCWSSCSLEHLGSLDNGLEFILNSIKTLKKGGIAIHTTEYNLDPDSDTFEDGPTVLYQKKHILGLQKKLEPLGYTLEPIDFSIGDGFLDKYIDLPPYPFDAKFPWDQRILKAHLKLALDDYAVTSIGFIIKSIS